MDEVSERDLQMLDRFTAYAQIEHQGVVMPCFTLVTRPLPEVDPEVLEAIKQNSRKQLDVPVLTAKTQVELVRKAALPKGSIALDK
jgi:hypothetical protein